MARKGFGTVLTNLTLSDRFSTLSDTKPVIESNPFWLNKSRPQIKDTNAGQTTDENFQRKVNKIKVEDKENTEPMDIVMTKKEKPRNLDLSSQEQFELAKEVKRRAHLNLLLNEKKMFRNNFKYRNRGLTRPLHTIKSSFGNRISGYVHNFRSNRGPTRKRYNRKPIVTKEELDYDLELYMANAGHEPSATASNSQ